MSENQDHPIIFIGFPGWMTREEVGLAFVELTDREPGYITEPIISDRRDMFCWVLGRVTLDEVRRWMTWYNDHVGDRWRLYVMGRETVMANIEPDDKVDW
jgi:hypothetical protein